MTAFIAFCLDIDECSTNLHSCQHGSCVNKYGGYDCDCDAGYSGQYCQQGAHDKLACFTYVRTSAVVTCGWLLALLVRRMYIDWSVALSL